MAQKSGSAKKAEGRKASGGRTGEGASREKKVVRALIKKMEAKLAMEEVKPTVGDFLRLLQFQRELEEEEPREVTAQWVEPPETESGGGG
ncbi:MAG: hypothetical protein ACRD44_16485 [Bryobacteraceae bacterium]